jgi:hypothetical protein
LNTIVENIAINHWQAASMMHVVLHPHPLRFQISLLCLALLLSCIWLGKANCTPHASADTCGLTEAGQICSTDQGNAHMHASSPSAHLPGTLWLVMLQWLMFQACAEPARPPP